MVSISLSPDGNKNGRFHNKFALLQYELIYLFEKFASNAIYGQIDDLMVIRACRKIHNLSYKSIRIGSFLYVQPGHKMPGQLTKN